MAQVGNEKILGGLGSIFIILGFIPWIGWLLGIAGIVLLFIAINKLAQIFSDKNIFNKFLTGFLISTAGILLAFIFGMFSMIPLMMGNFYHGMNHIPTGGLIFFFLIFYALNITGMYFYRQCFNLLHQYTQINLFSLAGIFMFWGAVGIILFGLGAIAIFVGWILLAIAFFSLPEHYEGKNTV
ncbi:MULTISPECIES: DUF996 domain-containing protein [Thermodesulfovibrio]|jgi:uncharacterized membrane protein|uniref:DUF996 domain-containing protein n=2 Tax=Thermodesulfovibrio TaxID=28261 RepID=A0A2J6WN79_9BACT|nr:MAG: hypothetical protein C0186_02655 [Thermodesulfovibrio aggregans]